MSWVTVVLAGLVDGLNPCAFATLIFFVSYLTISGRKNREVIIVGISFTLGVFIAYLVIGLGFYKVLDLLGNLLNIVSRWVYGLTALLCIGLAVFSFMDVAKAREGNLKDMSLNLPEGLRKRVNAVIRKGRSTNRYVVSAFITGLVISLLELACTGQVYLPTIIFVSSMPELRLRAIFYLIIYNLLFILPLVVVFVLAYFGTTSKELTRFLQKRAAAVKIGLGILFFALGAWLLVTAVA
jgi:cytochrome c biogenesis protein CcdA